MKTKVNSNREEDMKELELSFEDTHRFDYKKMFPESNWEFLRWSRTDGVGFFWAMMMVVGILVLLWVSVNLGGKI
ncbi:MAG: hypothetical protein HC906_01510 [Bacteroidales bacterium]|nr:hypothetical protein [Bacteroidales bacterium]